MKTAAYSDYLRAVAASRHLRSDEDLRDADRDLADAKARIAVYGSPEVLRALASIEEAGAVLNSERSLSAFLDLVTAMRPKGAVEREQIRAVLFGRL